MDSSIPLRELGLKRALLLKAGARLISSAGLERVNSNQIARAAGVGVGTFYLHFKDKYELHQAIVLDALAELRSRTQQAPTEGDVESEVRALTDAVVGLAEQRPEQFRVAFGRELSGSSGRPLVGYSIRSTERRLRELRDAGRLDPELHPAVAAKAFVAMQNGVVAWWSEDQSRAPRAALVETLVRLHPAVAGARRP